MTILRATIALCFAVASCGGPKGKASGGDDASTRADTKPDGADGALASCKALGRHFGEVCGEDAAFETELCEDGRVTYEPIGCGAEYGEFVRCYSEADIPDCEDGTATGCPPKAVLLSSPALTGLGLPT